MEPKEHWEKVYQEKDPTTDVSWFQAHPTISLQLIAATGIKKEQPLIDVGGGASRLVDCLLSDGFHAVAVLDISGAAINLARQRLGDRARAVTWIEANITSFVPPHPFRLWHDRAVFHFLTQPEDRRGYVRALKRAVPPGGHVILASFAEDGPLRCSGLPVVRYGAESICAQLGPEFRLLDHRRETHVTPWQAEQKFNWFRFERGLSPEASVSPDRPEASQAG